MDSCYIQGDFQMDSCGRLPKYRVARWGTVVEWFLPQRLSIRSITDARNKRAQTLFPNEYNEHVTKGKETPDGN